MKSILAVLALFAGAALPASAQADAPAAAPGGRLMGAALNVSDLGPELKFYTEGLGMRVAMTLEHGARVETILTFGTDTRQASILLMSDKQPATAKARTHGDAFSRLVVGIGDLDAVGARLSELGYPHGPIRDAGHGARVLVVTDPAGFELELVQHANAL